jgi:hypothetical protein
LICIEDISNNDFPNDYAVIATRSYHVEGPASQRGPSHIIYGLTVPIVEFIRVQNEIRLTAFLVVDLKQGLLVLPGFNHLVVLDLLCTGFATNYKHLWLIKGWIPA